MRCVGCGAEIEKGPCPRCGALYGNLRENEKPMEWPDTLDDEGLNRIAEIFAKKRGVKYG